MRAFIKNHLPKSTSVDGGMVARAQDTSCSRRRLRFFGKIRNPKRARADIRTNDDDTVKYELLEKDSRASCEEKRLYNNNNNHNKMCET